MTRWSYLIRLTCIIEWIDKFIHLLGAALILWFCTTSPAVGARPLIVYLLGVFFLLLGGYAINDVADFRQDAEVPPGRRRPMTVRTHSMIAAWTGLAAGILLILAAAQTPLARTLAILTVVVGVEYSMPPIRFKERGLLGVLVGAAAQKPALFLIFVAMLGAWNWLSAVLATWLFLGSLVGLLGHQIRDVRNDEATGVRTFATRAGARSSLRICGSCAAGVGLTVLAPFAFTSPSHAWPIAAALAALSSVYAFKGLKAFRVGALRA